MLVLAHRGYHAEAPENTLAAFDAALQLGVDGIETDVRLSADGKAVIMHDRITRAGRAVSAISHPELEADVGHRVPLLDEIFEAFPTVLWNIEIKHPEVWAVAAPILKQFQRSRRIFVTSFRHDVVARCAAELEVDCGMLIADRPLNIADTIASCAELPRVCGIVWDYNILDDGVLRAVAAAGWQNYVYGAVTAAEHQRCGTLKLAGLITDFPQRAGRGA